MANSWLSQEIVDRISGSGEKILVFDQRPHSALDLLTALILRRSVTTKTSFYDFWGDPAGSSTERPSLLPPTNILDRFLDQFQNVNTQNTIGHLIVFDSTVALLTMSVHQFCVLIEEISARIQSIEQASVITFAVLHHTDVFDLHAEKALRFLSSSSFYVRNSSHNRQNEREFVCVVNHLPRRKTHINRIEKIVIDQDWKMRFELVDPSRQRLDVVHHSQISTIENLTFNLKLTDEELSARNRVQLPHVHGGGVIYYEPDEADDIDYEDPDE